MKMRPTKLLIFGSPKAGTPLMQAAPSIAIDLPIVPRNTQLLVDKLNELVLREGGRIYLAKDALTRADHFRAMEPRLEAWMKVRKAWDPSGRFKSAQSVRLLGDSA